jgi:hypothetical protein
MKVKRQFTVFSICFIALLLATTLSVGQVVQNTGSSDYTTQAQKDFANAKIFVQNLLNTTLPNVNLQVVTNNGHKTRGDEATLTLTSPIFCGKKNSTKASSSFPKTPAYIKQTWIGQRIS